MPGTSKTYYRNNSIILVSTSCTVSVPSGLWSMQVPTINPFYIFETQAKFRFHFHYPSTFFAQRENCPNWMSNIKVSSNCACTVNQDQINHYFTIFLLYNSNWDIVELFSTKSHFRRLSDYYNRETRLLMLLSFTNELNSLHLSLHNIQHF